VFLDAGRGEVGELDVIYLSEEVVVRWDDYQAEVEHAEYRRGTGLVTSKGPVLLEGPGLQVEGEGMEVNVEGRTARVHRDVRAEIRGVSP
ncbi:MAG: LPS export ABC transporter periplasmic protein LptC, partial [Deferrisomatales bacterium]